MNIPIINSISNDIKNFYPTSLKLAKAGKDGYKIGKRTSSIYKSGITCDFYNRGKGVCKKIANETTIENLPLIAGALGTLIPVFLANPICYAIGLTAKEIILTYRSKKNKNCSEHSKQLRLRDN